jgi:hypothetical protein
LKRLVEVKALQMFSAEKTPHLPNPHGPHGPQMVATSKGGALRNLPGFLLLKKSYKGISGVYLCKIFNSILELICYKSLLSIPDNYSSKRASLIT